MAVTKEELRKQKEGRLGEENYNYQGCLMKIIEYNKATDIVVEFQDKYKSRVHTAYDNFKKGIVKNPYFPSVYGVGITGNKIPTRKGSDKEHTKEYSAWITMFTCIQDNNPNAINELEAGMLPDDRFLDSQMETIKKDGTVENAMSYELDDLETPVTLKATRGVGGEELGEQTFEIK